MEPRQCRCHLWRRLRQRVAARWVPRVRWPGDGEVVVLIESGRPDFNLASTERFPGDPICINSAFVDVSPRVWIPSVAADAALPFAVAPHAFARAVVSAACAAVPFVVFGCRWRFSWQPARVPFPAAAGASGVPDSVWRLAVLAVV